MYKNKLLFVAISVFYSGIVLGNESRILNEVGIAEITNRQITIIPKDPLIAGLMSALSPGLGQIYCQNL